MQSFIRRALSSVGVGAFVYGKLASAGDYRILRQCHDLVEAGEVVTSCDNLPVSIEGKLGFMLVGFILVALAGTPRISILRTKRWIKKRVSSD